MVEKQSKTNPPEKDVMLEVRNLKQYFPIRAGLMQRVVGNVKAVDGISFTIERGKTMGLVGESGWRVARFPGGSGIRSRVEAASRGLSRRIPDIRSMGPVPEG